MAIENDGIFFSDMIVGEKEDVSDVATILAPGGFAFGNSIGMFTSPAKANSLTHKWIDDARRPMRTTLATTVNSSVTSIVLTDDIYKSGQYIVCEGEVILLGTKTAAKTFNCTRSSGTVAAAAHTAGAYIGLVGNPAHQGIAAGDADVIYTPGERTNYCQRGEWIAESADEVNAALRYGQPGSQFDDNVRQKIKHAMIEMQMTALIGPTATAPVPSTPTAGVCKGLVEWFLAASNSTDCGGGNMTMERLRTMVESVAEYFEDGEPIPAVLLHPISQSFVFDDYQQAHIQIAPGDPFVATYGSPNVRRLRVGPMMIDTIPMARLRDTAQAVVYKPDMVKSAHYLPLTFEKLARDGGRDRGMIYVNHTLEVRAPAHGWVFYDVSI